MHSSEIQNQRKNIVIYRGALKQASSDLFHNPSRLPKLAGLLLFYSSHLVAYPLDD